MSPSENTVRPEVMEAYRQSNDKFRELYQMLVRQREAPETSGDPKPADSDS